MTSRLSTPASLDYLSFLFWGKKTEFRTFLMGKKTTRRNQPDGGIPTLSISNRERAILIETKKQSMD